MFVATSLLICLVSLPVDLLATADADSSGIVVVLPTEIDEAQRDLASTRDALGDLLAILVQRDQRFRVVERDELRSVLEEQKLQATGAVDAGSAAQLGKLFHADYIVTSALATDNDELRLHVQLVEVKGARVARAAEERGQLRELEAMFQRAIQALAEGLGVQRTSLRPEDMDRSPRVSLHFMRGLAFYHEGLPLRAQVEFMKVTALEPIHEGAMAYIAKCFHDAGQPEHARLAAEALLAAYPTSPFRDEIERILRDAGGSVRE